jgi:hypothetical protein
LPGTDAAKFRKYLIEKSGMSPAVYDNGTHYVIFLKLTLEKLKELSDSDDVVEVAGEYTGHIGAYVPFHEHGKKEEM